MFMKADFELFLNMQKCGVLGKYMTALPGKPGRVMLNHGQIRQASMNICHGKRAAKQT